jgi:predicted anti-sigma-YlaC factor YlaD
MITCRELTDLLLDFVAGELPSHVQEHIQQHLEWCPPCVTYLETYRLTIQLTRKLPCEPLPEELLHRLRAALEDSSEHGCSGTG